MTIKTVAEYTKLSVATVSRVLNDDGCVDERTREKVKNAIKELGYVPNLLGRNLRRGNTKLVYVLLSSVVNPFFAEIVQGIEDAAGETGYRIMLGETYDNPARYVMLSDAVRNNLADGIILLSPARGAIEYFSDLPVAVCCESHPSYTCMQSDIDNEKAAADAVKYLIGLGRKTVAFLGANHVSGFERERGYRRALLEAGLDVNERAMMPDCVSYENGRAATLELMERGIRPDALFTCSDIIAMGALRAFEESGVRVPEDVAVMGFDDLIYSKMHSPALSTVRQPCREMGRTAFGLLDGVLNGGATPKRTVLRHELIIRESTESGAGK
ncbi:LacI family transcriptional regulator [Clostridia bacterium]|nr:LacI family transcriptional regulator [Clostridia bacterium]